MLSSTSKAKGWLQDLFTNSKSSRSIGGLESYWDPQLWIQMRRDIGYPEPAQVKHNPVPSSFSSCFLLSEK